MGVKLHELHFPNAPNILVEPPGPNAKRLLDKQKEIETKAVLYPLAIPLVPEEARGATLKDVDGNTYIDLFSGVGVVNVGHCNAIVLETVKMQLEKLVHALDFPTTVRLDLVEKLIEIAPGELKGNSKVWFGSPSGADAVEAAVKLAKYNTKRRIILAFEGGYHGQTAMALAVTSAKKFKKDFVPLTPEVHFLPYAYCYRCAFGLKYPSCGLQCVEYVKHVLDDPYSGVTEPAAIIVEPVQGEGGVITPPNEFLSKLRKVCHEYSVLLIVDEVQAGFGRTGKMFACEHSNIAPDIITLAKAIGGIGLPLSAILYDKKLDTWEPGAHVGTFRGHVTAMAAGLAAINFIQENNLLDHVNKVGERMLRRLRELEGESKYIGEVRGKGLMIGIEFVKNKETKEPWKEIVDEIQKRCFKHGVLIWKAGHYSNIIRFLPPLVITEELADKAIEVFTNVVKEVERDFV